MYSRRDNLFGAYKVSTCTANLWNNIFTNVLTMDNVPYVRVGLYGEASSGDNVPKWMFENLTGTRHEFTRRWRGPVT
jgi:hypothetical protein